MTQTTNARPTRFEGLGFVSFGPNDWRFADTTEPHSGFPFAVVGEIYRTKTELLADLPRFAAERGYVAS